jgi:hypothetical protein
MGVWAGVGRMAQVLSELTTLQYNMVDINKEEKTGPYSYDGRPQ